MWKLCGHTLSSPSMDSKFSAMSATSLLVLSELSRKFRRSCFVSAATSLLVLSFTTLEISTLRHFDSSLSLRVSPYSLEESNLADKVLWVSPDGLMHLDSAMSKDLLQSSKPSLTSASTLPQFFLLRFLLHPFRVRGLYSARVPRSSLASVHRVFILHIVEEEAEHQVDEKDDRREKSGQQEEEGTVAENQTYNMSAWRWRMRWREMCAAHAKLEPWALSLEPRASLWLNEKMWRVRCAVRRLQQIAISCKRSDYNIFSKIILQSVTSEQLSEEAA